MANFVGEKRAKFCIFEGYYYFAEGHAGLLGDLLNGGGQAVVVDVLAAGPGLELAIFTVFFARNYGLGPDSQNLLIEDDHPAVIEVFFHQNGHANVAHDIVG